MYGTLARGRLKPGSEDKMIALMEEFISRQVPGLVAEYIYRMDANPNEYWTAVVFTSKDAYFANANSPEQNELYQRLAALFEDEPQWHDGEIVFPRPPA